MRSVANSYLMSQNHSNGKMDISCDKEPTMVRCYFINARYKYIYELLNFAFLLIYDHNLAYYFVR